MTLLSRIASHLHISTRECLGRNDVFFNLKFFKLYMMYRHIIAALLSIDMSYPTTVRFTAKSIALFSISMYTVSDNCHPIAHVCHEATKHFGWKNVSCTIQHNF